MSDKIKQAVTELVAQPANRDFIFGLLAAYDTSKDTIRNFRRRNETKDMPWCLRRKVLYEWREDGGVIFAVEKLLQHEKYKREKPRFVIAAGMLIISAYDTKTGETLEVEWKDLPEHYEFFNPLAGIDKVEFKEETKHDKDAAAAIAAIYDGIIQKNDVETDADRHRLNSFLSRMLFCFFAEDTGIFDRVLYGSKEMGAFEKYIRDMGDAGRYGTDFMRGLNEFFTVLNTPEKDRGNMGLSADLAALPYVNGGLFGDIDAECFSISDAVRRDIADCCKLDWSKTNPDVLGSMFQAVVSTEKRGNLGQHYTSVPNIMKVIKPLFLDGLRENYEKNYDKKGELRKMLVRLSNLRIFDPACGSGNFLIISYKELRHLEIDILKRLQEMGEDVTGSCIQLSQFKGIELDDFPREIAELSMWLAEHQMNQEFANILGEARTNLPLDSGGYIRKGNALRMDWEEVCPKENGAEIYILGNPPFLGSKKQIEIHKKDMEVVFRKRMNLDYVTSWFKFGSEYIKNANAKFAFVSTNTICQGEQVPIFWPMIFENDQSIEFAYQSFLWNNNAKDVAGVAVVIIGVGNNNIGEKYLFFDGERQEVKNITPYLKSGENMIIYPRSTPLSDMLPKTVIGNIAYDDRNLILTSEEYENVVKNNPEVLPYVKKYIGAKQFIKGIKDYCLWITDDEKDDALKIPFIKERVEKCRQFRISSRGKCIQGIAKQPWKFFAVCFRGKNSILVPYVTTNRRKYIPMGFCDDDTVINGNARGIYDAELYVFGIISSRMHTLWAGETSSEMGNTGYRYSSKFTYNTFPVQNLTIEQKSSIEEKVKKVLAEREKNYEKTIEYLYDLDTMPSGLLKVHQELDVVVEDCFRPGKPFENDEERVEFLFAEYERLIALEKQEK